MTIACSNFKLHHFYCAQPKWSVLLVRTIGDHPTIYIYIYTFIGPSLSEASVRRSTSPLSWYIDRPSDFRSRTLNRRLTAPCFVVSAHSVRWIDTHDACWSCRPKVCLSEVVELRQEVLQKQEKNHARNFWWRVPARQGRSEVKQLRWLVLNIKPKRTRARSGSYRLSWNS